MAEKQNLNFLFRLIEHISNKQYHQDAWVSGSYGIGFDDLCCIFFNTIDFIMEKYKDYEISDQHYFILKKFKEEFEAFADDNSWPPFFIETPEWAKIMESAKGVLKVFDYKK